MILPDVNVLLNAFRSDAQRHAVCLEWLQRLTNAGERFALSPLVLSAVVRLSTNRRVFDPPSEPAEALRFCEELMAHPLCVLVTPGAGHWPIFSRLVKSIDARADLVPDAWLAALSIEHGCEWITLDRDFGKFPGLRWRTPG